MNNHFPSIENQPVNLSLDIKEISVYEPPKHDPCRLFKKGDEVEYRPKDGRANPNLLVGRRYKVSADEPCDSGIVQVEFDGLRHIDTFVAYNNLKLITPIEELKPYSVVELSNGDYAVYKGDERLCVFRDGELVTPVEELEPYTIREYEDHYAVEKDGAMYSTFFKGSYHANAKAAAEAECDRLNAEYRKEMGK